MIDYLDDKTRIKLKYYFPATRICYVLQRKKWYGWKTVSWIQKIVIDQHPIEYTSIKEWLLWDENK